MKSAGRRTVGPAGAVVFVALATCCLCCTVRAQDGGGRSLAVVETNPELAPLSLLVQAQLTQKGLVLVERGELDRVLQEQELSAAGLASPDALVKVGALLRADGFLLLSLEEAGPPLPAPPGIPGVPGAAEAPAKREELVRIRLSETAHGVRLLDWFVGWDPKKAEEAAAEVVAKVSEVAPKLKLPAGQLFPIGIVDVHRVQLGEEHQWACRAFAAMLSARLSKEPRVVVLEREDLRRLLEEKLLTAGQDAKFWRSGVLIEGYMQRAGKEGIELKLQCKRPGGEELPVAPLAVDVEKLQEAVDKAAQGIMAAVANVPLTSAWDPAKEAEEFFRQGELLINHGRYVAARPILDTASALDPTKLEYADALLWEAACAATPNAEPWLYTDAELADLVARVMPLARKAIMEPPGLPYDAANPTWALQLYFNTGASVATESIRDANRENREIAVKLYEKVMAACPWEKVPANRLLPAAALTRSSTPAEGLANLEEAIRPVLMPPGRGGENLSDSVRAQACCELLRGLLEAPKPFHLGDTNNTLVRGVLTYLEELSEDNDPIVRFFGGVAACRWVNSLFELIPPGLSGGEEYMVWWRRMNDLFAPFHRGALVPFVDKASGAFIKDLRCGQDIEAAAKRSMIVELLGALSSYGVACPPEKRITAFETIYGDLIERGDVDSLIWVQSALEPSTLPVDAQSDNTPPEVVARSLRLLERIGAALQADGSATGVAKGLRHTRRATNETRDALDERIRLLQRVAQSEDKERFPRQAEASRTRIAQLRESCRQPRPKAPLGEFSIRMLLRGTDWPRPWDFSWTTWRCIRPDSQQPVLWIASVWEDSQAPEVRVALAGLDLDKRSAFAAWQICSKARLNVSVVPRPPALVMGERKSYVAIEGVGLVELPGSAAVGKGVTDAPRILGPKNSLPPACITGIAPHGSKLWVAYAHNGSGLGIYDPEAEEWQTVLSSEVRGDGPFQDGAAYEFRELTPIPGGLMLFASISPGGCGTSPFGAWRLDAATGKVQPLFGLYDLYLASYDGRTLWAAGPNILAQLLPGPSRVEIALEDREYTTRIPWLEQSAWTVSENPFVPVQEQEKVPFSIMHLEGLDPFTGAVHGDEFWARYGRSQIIVLRRGKGLDEATIMDNNILEGGKVLQFFETPYGLIAIGEGSVGLIEGSP